ncbi:MAG: acyl carrier protein [Tolypothrix brevis GSE-NOS-MK-07-07A]|jgi:acyl carrier protein|nr:acyl carrier protein [Tolypothrix brevis GSE-NOS-MK-07-07A]
MIEPLKYINSKQSIPEGLVWSEKNHDFKDLPPEFWNVHLESYQICKNWLKNHECILNSEEEQCYQRIVTVLKEIGKLIEEVKEPIQLNRLKKLKILAKLRVIVADKLGIEANKINPLSNFVNDLEADSLDILELFNALEEAFNIEIHTKVVDEVLLTVQQTIDFISKKIENPIML